MKIAVRSAPAADVMVEVVAPVEMIHAVVVKLLARNDVVGKYVTFAARMAS